MPQRAPRLVVLLLALIVGAASAAQPAKRAYDSHVYYVLELAPGTGESPAQWARSLGAELVEQVGELADHYLLRASHGVVEAGAPGTLVRRALGDEQLVAQRDAVLERYALLQQTHAGLHTRSVHPVRSLERQHLKKRTKREFIALSPVLYGSGVLPRSYTPRSPAALPQIPTTVTPVPKLISEIARRFAIADPLFPRQWHIINAVMEANSVNVTGVWADGIFGKGVNVAIVDDGLDMHSDDLAPNFHAEGSWDYNDNTALPEPRLSDDQHGTRCAGEIAAAKNDVCGVGIAYKAGIAGIRILSASISDADEAAALNYGYQSNSIYSCSWGPPDDGRSMEAPGRLIVKAMLNGVQKGRGGKGSVFVFASGNGGAVDDQCNFDGYTNSLMSITVGALDRKGLHPFYSEACSANMVVTYSSGSGDNIHTTDVGKNLCTDRHGGTSAAAPIAAGIFALVLEARPDLTWRDMQHLCVKTAVQINNADPDWQLTASGRYYNHKYGFGKLDAWAIVNAAKTHKLVKPQAWWDSQKAESGEAITKAGVVSSIVVSAADLRQHNLEKLEHVTVVVHIDHQRRGNVEVELVSPKGMTSILARARRFDDADTGLPNWMFMSVKHWDEDPVGTWILRVKDQQSNGKNGTFNSWSMSLWGASIDASKATLWQLPSQPQDIVRPPPVDSSSAVGTPTVVPVIATLVPSPLPTKSIPRPTEHLPEDHAEAPGEVHPTLLPTPSPTPLPSTEDPFDMDNDEEDDEKSYLAGLKSLVGSTTWIFVASGTIIVFVGAFTAFFWMKKRRTLARLGRSGGYDFAPTDEEEVPMGALDRGRVRLGGSTTMGGGGAGRTRDLYDAFALEESDEEGSDGDDEALVHRDRGRVKEDVAYSDQAMANFLDEPEEEVARGTTEEEEGRRLVEDDRSARERFSD